MKLVMKTTAKEIEALVANLKPRVKLPRGFAFWSDKMIVLWLKSNQKPLPKPQKEERR